MAGLGSFLTLFAALDFESRARSLGGEVWESESV